MKNYKKSTITTLFYYEFLTLFHIDKQGDNLFHRVIKVIFISRLIYFG